MGTSFLRLLSETLPYVGMCPMYVLVVLYNSEGSICTALHADGSTHVSLSLLPSGA